jgi:hypothetical protein
MACSRLEWDCRLVACDMARLRTFDVLKHHKALLYKVKLRILLQSLVQHDTPSLRSYQDNARLIYATRKRMIQTA